MDALTPVCAAAQLTLSYRVSLVSEWGQCVCVCGCSLTCCLDETGVVGPLDGRAVLARGRLCSWRAQPRWSHSSDSASWCHSTNPELVHTHKHIDTHTENKICHFCLDVFSKEVEKFAQMSHHLKTKHGLCVHSCLMN